MINIERRRKQTREAMRRYREKNRAIILQREREWALAHPQRAKKIKADAQRSHFARHPDKVRARRAVNKAIILGKIIKPDYCQHCGSLEKLHGHHRDYSLRLEVIWLCSNCHRLEHQ